MQRGEMQGLAFTKMIGLMAELSKFASKPVMNFKVLVFIHRMARKASETPL